ncbi:hypothetical protein Nizo1840_1265 [Lactiplantibacillus plantarum]|nr:hypothetical protein Nizo1840_1265 [Lactiplantibacillus plantarum]
MTIKHKTKYLHALLKMALKKVDFLEAIFLYDEFTIEVQQMIKKKTHSLSPCKI